MKIKLINIFTIILILIVVVYILLSNFSCCYASDDIGAIIGNMKGSSKPETTANSLTKGINVIYTIIRIAGTGIALLMVMILGIKYMMASVEEKADIKKQAIPILVGSALIFATSNIIIIVAKIVF